MNPATVRLNPRLPEQKWQTQGQDKPIRRNKRPARGVDG